MTRLKIATSLALFVVSCAVITTTITAHLFPAIPGATAAVAVVMLLSVWGNDIDSHRAVRYLIVLLGLALVLRLYEFQFPASMIGIDPDQYGIQVYRILDANEISAISFNFYDKAPLHLLAIGIAVEILQLPVSDAMFISSATLTILATLGAFLFAVDLSTNEPFRSGVIAASLALCSTTLVRYSILPIAQTTAVAYWVVLILALTRYFATLEKRHLATALVISLCSVLTHKLSLLVLGSALLWIFGGIVLLSHFSSSVSWISAPDTQIKRMIGSIAVLSGVVFLLMFLQWAELTSYFPAVVAKAASFFSPGGIAGSVYDPKAATSPAARIVTLLADKAHAIALLAFGGISWLILFVRDNDKFAPLVLLLTTAGVTSLIFFGVADPHSITPTRVIFYAEVPILGVIGAVAANVRNKRWRQIGLTSVLIVFVVTQVFSLPALVDGPLQPRIYLNSEEMAGKEWSHKYVNDEIWTDNYYAHESTVPISADEQQTQFQTLDKRILDATLFQDPNRPEYIAKRDIRIYRYGARFGNRVLSWPYLVELKNRYSRVYSSGGATVHKDTFHLDVRDSMEILLPHENVGQVWGARDRALNRAREHVSVTGLFVFG